MVIRIDRITSGEVREKDLVFFTALTDNDSIVTVELDASAWATIKADWRHDPFAGVEELAKQGHLKTLGEERVLRIDFI